MKAQLIDLLANTTGLSASAISPTAHLTRDLGLDSLDVVDLVMQLEQTFGLSIPDEDYSLLTTVEEINSYLGKKLQVPA